MTTSSGARAFGCIAERLHTAGATVAVRDVDGASALRVAECRPRKVLAALGVHSRAEGRASSEKVKTESGIGLARLR